MSKIEVSKMSIRPEAEQILHFSAVYIYIYMCVCVCVCVERERERERCVEKECAFMC